MSYSFSVIDFIPAALFLCSGMIGITVSVQRGWKENKRLLYFAIADILLCLCLTGAALLRDGLLAVVLRFGLIVVISLYILFRTKQAYLTQHQHDIERKNPEKKEGENGN